jgi:TolB-like protein
MTPSLRLTILGTPGIAGPDGRVAGPAGQGQPLALLAVLASAGERGISRDRLLALFWPDASAERASHRLSQLAHQLRRSLGCSDLITGGGELRLHADRIGCDLWELLAARRQGDLEEAARLYAGPLLDGFFLPDQLEFERWLESRRSALARDHGETLEALAVRAELAGDTHAAAAWWGRLAQHEPLSSRVTMHLMTALAASGQRARALEHALTYQTQLKAELEADPNPAVLALAEQLKRRSRAESRIAIGVLPLAALEGGKAAEALAMGLTEELTSAAAALPGVRVASRSSMLAVQQAADDIRAMASRLGLGAVLEGSVRTVGGKVRLTMRLVDAADGYQLWSEQFERDVVDGFETQDALTRDVMAQVGARVQGLLTAG